MFIVISIHALRVEGDAYPGTKCVNKLYFYPRPPGGGRLSPCDVPLSTVCISIHALRVEGDIQVVAVETRISLFLSTPSGWRATLSAHAGFTRFALFLSTPSGWRATPGVFSFSATVKFLSTPSGWRATKLAAFLNKMLEISIHALRVEGDAND